MKALAIISFTLLTCLSASDLSKKEDIPLQEEISGKSDKEESENGFKVSKPLYYQWVGLHPSSKLHSSKTQAKFNSRDGEVHRPHLHPKKDKSYYSNDYEGSDNYGPSSTSYVRPEEPPNYGAKITNFPFRPKDYQTMEAAFPARPTYSDKGYPYSSQWQGGGFDSPYPGYNYPYNGFGQSNGYDGSMSGKFFGSLRNRFGKDGLNILLGLLPAALLVAALVPNFVVVPVQGVTAGSASGIKGVLSNLSGRKRRAVPTNPVLDLIEEYGVKSLDDPNCMRRIVCQVTRQGRENGNFIQRLFYQLANIISEKRASYFGLKYLTKAIKRNKCEAFTCPRVKRQRSQ